MRSSIAGIEHWFDPGNAVGAALYGVVVFALASLFALAIRRSTRRIERGLSDITVLQFVSVFAQFLAYLVGFVLYAHLVPPLRALGTALLAGAAEAVSQSLPALSSMTWTAAPTRPDRTATCTVTSGSCLAVSVDSSTGMLEPPGTVMPSPSVVVTWPFASNSSMSTTAAVSSGLVRCT